MMITIAITSKKEGHGKLFRPMAFQKQKSHGGSSVPPMAHFLFFWFYVLLSDRQIGAPK
jgi:hypothetical protein